MAATINGTLVDDTEDVPTPTIPAFSAVLADSWCVNQQASTFCGTSRRGTPHLPTLQRVQHSAIGEIHQNKRRKEFLSHLGAIGQ
jgi:hypothetical protein